MPVCIYHGTPVERAELRKTTLAPPHLRAEIPKAKTTKSTPKSKSKARTTKNSAGRKAAEPIVISDSEDDEREPDEDFDESFPIVLTTSEMIIKDRVHLAKYNWGYIVVDEGHRLKNLDCALMREIKKYPSAGRMILTGTPLHVSPPQTTCAGRTELRP